jgi:hypothetical protein
MSFPNLLREKQEIKRVYLQLALSTDLKHGQFRRLMVHLFTYKTITRI